MILKKPDWLKKKIDFGEARKLHQLLDGLDLHTVCREARCPNICECSSWGVATLLILGRICSRNCQFCAVEKGKPGAVDAQEPARVADAVARMKLKHVVITSVTRDDLADGGAGIFAEVISGIRKTAKDTAIEVLVPDFCGDPSAIKKVVKAKPEVFAHNLETVPRLYPKVRQMADYRRSLGVLKMVKEIDPQIKTKSGLMLGLGESEQEVLAVLDDLRGTGCDYLSLGQYLSPSLEHYPVAEYVVPEKFVSYKIQAQALGFQHVESAPYVRSSYHAAGYK